MLLDDVIVAEQTATELRAELQRYADRADQQLATVQANYQDVMARQANTMLDMAAENRALRELIAVALKTQPEPHASRIEKALARFS